MSLIGVISKCRSECKENPRFIDAAVNARLKNRNFEGHRSSMDLYSSPTAAPKTLKSL